MGIKLLKVFLTLIVIFIIFPFSIKGEEKLNKFPAKYLGWVISKEDFKTCSENIIKVEYGIIEKTDEKCKRDKPPGPLISKGKIKNIDLGKQIFAIETDKGQHKEFFYYPKYDALMFETVKSLNNGDYVAIKAYPPERAQKIDIIKKNWKK